MEKTTNKPVRQEIMPARKDGSEAQGEQQYEIDLIELLYRLLENARYIIVAALIGALLAWAYTVVMIVPKYTARSKLYVLNTDDAAIKLADLQIGNYLATDYMEVFKNWHVHEMVLQRLGLPYSYGKIGSMISVTNPTNTRILYISATAESPDEAKNIADTYAEVAREFIATTMDTREPNVFEEALRPTSPSSPNKTRNVALGFILGAVLACGIITLQYIMDDKIHSSDDVEKYLGIPALGMLPLQQGKSGNHQKSQKKRKGGATA